MVFLPQNDSIEKVTGSGALVNEPPPDGFKGIVNRGPAVVFIWRVGEGWPIEFVSENVRQWGYEAEALVAGRVTGRDTVHPQDLARLEAEVARYLAEGVREYAQEYRIRTASGETRWVEDRNTVIRDAAGEPRYIQGIVLDVTERKRLERTVAKLGLAEREKLGRDLHDSLAQDLAALRFLCAALAEKAPAVAPHLKPLIDEIHAAADSAYSGVKKLAQGLCPVELADRELEPALRSLAERISLASGITCTFRSHGWCSQCTDKLVASSVYRIAVEAVTNALSHAKASRIDIRLSRKAQQCVMAVRDNGEGFDPRPGSRGGMGITNMTYRASLIGGTLDIHRDTVGGTLLTCTFSPD
jgi:PAS domain S-box-containing protein